MVKADGEASRFNQVLTEYQKAPEVTRKRLYLDAMEGVLSNSSKVLVDVDNGNSLMYLPLDKMMGQSNNLNSGDLSNNSDGVSRRNRIAQDSGRSTVSSDRSRSR